MNEQEYLGTVVTSNGNNTKTIANKVSRGQGIINDIMNILNSIPIGKYYFETALILRSSLLLSVLTHDVEVLHNLTKNDVKKLESLDNQLISKIMETSTKTSICLKMLELGLLPITYIIKKKRILYFQKLLKSDKRNLAKSILMTQMKKPKQGDFSKYLKKDLEEIGMDSLNVNDFERFSKNEFKKVVTMRIKQAAFKFLTSEKSKQTKGSLIKYNKLELQSYLKSTSGINAFEAKQIFNLKSDNLDVAKNFSNHYSKSACILDKQCPGEDSQIHYYECQYMSHDILTNQMSQISYEEIYGEDVNKQAFIMRIIMKAYKRRNEIITSSFDFRNDPADP